MDKSFVLADKVLNSSLLGVRSCYDEGKRVAETLMFDYHRQHGIGKSMSLCSSNCIQVQLLHLCLATFLVQK